MTSILETQTPCLRERHAVTDALVVVTSSFPIRGDGSEAAGSFVANVVEELSKTLAVRVVAPGPATARELWTHRVEVFRFAAPDRPLSTLKPWRLHDLRWIRRVWRGGEAATRAATEANGTASHILALWGLPCGEWARRAAAESGMRYSVWLLGSDVWTLGRIPFLKGRLARVIREAALAFADGYKLADDGQRIAGVPVTFLPSTRRIDLVDPPPPRDQPPYRLLFLGRWHPNKGVDLLLDALAMLDDEDWRGIECVEIQGGGPLDSLVRERVRALRTAGRPVEAGRFLTKPEAEAAIARADWVLIPSRIESIPVVFSDAMKLGRPVIASPVGDLPQLVGNGCGVACARVDMVAICDTIRAVVKGKVEFNQHAVNHLAAEFSLDTIAARILNIMATAGIDGR